MTAQDDFKSLLKAGKIVEGIQLAISQAVELQITTWVESGLDIKPDHSSDRMKTRISMLSGDIENEVSSQFIGNGPYRELRSFHQEQVNEGYQIIENNLLSLQKLFSVLSSIQIANNDFGSMESYLIDPPNMDDPIEIEPPVIESDPIPEVIYQVESEPEIVAEVISIPELEPMLPSASIVEGEIPVSETEPFVISQGTKPVVISANLDSLEWGDNQDWEELIDQSQTPTLKTDNDPQIIDEWEEVDLEEPVPPSFGPVDPDSLDFPDDDNWDELTDPVSSFSATANNVVVSAGDDEDWGDFDEDNIAADVNSSDTIIDIDDNFDFDDMPPLSAPPITPSNPKKPKSGGDGVK